MSITKEIGITDSCRVDQLESVELANKWLKAFCPGRKNFKRESPTRMCLFDSIVGAVYGEKAIEEYSKYSALQYFIMDDVLDPTKPEIFLTAKKPIGDAYLRDFHVFPKNMAWCMSFTHEDGWIGPLFTKHPSFDVLNRKNVQSVEARSKGYT